MGQGENYFKFRPVFVRCDALLPELALILEKAAFEKELVGNSGDLFWSVGAIAGHSKASRQVSDLVKEKFLMGWMAT